MLRDVEAAQDVAAERAAGDRRRRLRHRVDSRAVHDGVVLRLLVPVGVLMAVDRVAQLMAQHEGELIFGFELFEQPHRQDQGAVRRAFAGEGWARPECAPPAGNVGGSVTPASSFIITPLDIVVQLRRGHEALAARAHDAERERPVP